MTHVVAIIQEEGTDTAAGVWFPDLPGCFSAGDTLDEALRNAPEALGLWTEAMMAQGLAIPRQRTLDDLRRDPVIAAEMTGNLIALVPAPVLPGHIAAA